VNRNDGLIKLGGRDVVYFDSSLNFFLGVIVMPSLARALLSSPMLSSSSESVLLSLGYPPPPMSTTVSVADRMPPWDYFLSLRFELLPLEPIFICVGYTRE